MRLAIGAATTLAILGIGAPANACPVDIERPRVSPDHRSPAARNTEIRVSNGYTDGFDLALYRGFDRVKTTFVEAFDDEHGWEVVLRPRVPLAANAEFTLVAGRIAIGSFTTGYSFDVEPPTWNPIEDDHTPADDLRMGIWDADLRFDATALPRNVVVGPEFADAVTAMSWVAPIDLAGNVGPPRLVAPPQPRSPSGPPANAYACAAASLALLLLVTRGLARRQPIGVP